MENLKDLNDGVDDAKFLNIEVEKDKLKLFKINCIIYNLTMKEGIDQAIEDFNNKCDVITKNTKK